MKPSKHKRSRRGQWKNVGIIGFSLGGADCEAVRGVIKYKTEQARRWNVMMSTHDRVDFPLLLDTCGYDGIITHVTDAEYGAFLKKRKLLTVDLANRFPQLRFPTITADGFAVGQLAARDFLNHGFKNYWMVDYCFPGMPEPSHFYMGFHELLAQHGYTCRRIPADEVRKWQNIVARSEPWPPLLDAFYRSFADGWPAAVLTMSDRVGLSFANVMQMLEVAVPDQVAIMGVGDVEVLCDSCTPPLSSVRVPAKAIGYEAARWLDLMMQGKKCPPSPMLFRPDHIATRQSTDILSVSDPLVARAVRLLDQHHAEPITVKELAQDLNTNIRSLQLHFAATLNRSPKQELARIRVARAKALILSTTKQLKEIAHDAGFTTLSGFERTFHHVTGMSPRAFQEKYVNPRP